MFTSEALWITREIRCRENELRYGLRTDHFAA